MRADEPVRIGLPLDGWHLAVVDPETGVPVEFGNVGELVIAGVGTARYLDAEKDAAKFRRCPRSTGTAPTAAATSSAPTPRA